MDKYLYFRTQAVIGDDDDAAQSVVFPVASFMGMHPTSDTALTLFFKPQIRNHSDDAGAINNDSVILTVPTNRHKEAMDALVGLIHSSPASSLIRVADDHTGSYASTKWSAVGTISIAAALS